MSGEAVIVTWADRYAASFYQDWCGDDRPLADRMHSGAEDDHPLVQLLARHRSTHAQSQSAEDDLVGRLADIFTCGCDQGYAVEVVEEAATRIQSDAATIAELRKVFGKLLEWWPEGSQFSLAASKMGNGFSDDLTRARAALNKDADNAAD